MKVSVKLTKSTIDDLALYFGTMSEQYQTNDIYTYVHKKNFQTLAIDFFRKKNSTFHKRKQEKVSISISLNQFVSLCFFYTEYKKKIESDLYLNAVLPELLNNIRLQITRLMSIDNSYANNNEQLRIA